MTFIGIIGARNFIDRKSVEALVVSLPKDSIIVTGACTGVCKWAQMQASQMNMEVLVYKPDLTNTKSYFEISKRYYQRNRELIEKCDFVHAFISAANGYAGGTRFEIEYAAKIGIPIKLHYECVIDHVWLQIPRSFQKKGDFTTAWKKFFFEVVAP